MEVSASRIFVLGVGMLFAPPILAQVTTRVSISSAGAQGNQDSGGYDHILEITPDGRYVVFGSDADTLVPGDTNTRWDVFVRDRQTGTTERVSISWAGAEGNHESGSHSISADGRYVAFDSYATNLVPGDTNGPYPTGKDVFVRDRLKATTERISISTSGVQATFPALSGSCSISADGRFVAFVSDSASLVPGDTVGSNVFVRDRLSGTTEMVDLSSAGVQGNSSAGEPSISADGRYVAFMSSASNLVPGDNNGQPDVFVRDRQTMTTERVSVYSGGGQGSYASRRPAISADGRYVAFDTIEFLAPGDTHSGLDVFVHDRQTGTTDIVSISSAGAAGDDYSGYASISADGRHVTFDSHASTLVPGDTNACEAVFVRDLETGTTERVSVGSTGAEANHVSEGGTTSADGRYVALVSWASSLVPGDTNGRQDVFVRDRRGGTDFTSLCDPGANGVISCPCSNPPSGSDRGCDNSSSTGGAVLSAAGGTYLSSDSLVFTTSGERPTATSIVLQGVSAIAAGTVYGQGVRCVGGSLKRLFTKAASGGSITAPDFDLGDPSVSMRSAAKGDTILPGQSRWYLVYYRDPNVLGGCPASSTFNATQTGQVTWSP